MTEQGWVPDPNDPRKLRFRDGNGWTDFTKPNPDASAAMPSSPQSGAPSQVRLPGRPAPSAPPIVQPPAQSPNFAAPHQNAPHDPYAPQDPYAQNNQPQRPGYVQQNPQPQGFAGQVHQFNDRIGQGYGDQSFGGQMNGPAGHRPAESGRSVFSEKTLVVSQKRKIIEVTNEYSIYAADGSTLGAVVEVGQSSMRKVLRVMTNYDQFLTHRLEVRDNNGQVLLQLTRPAKLMKSSVIVQDAQGRELGRLIQRNVFGKIRFGIEAGGQEIGSLNAENWRAWNFAMLDAQGTEIARVTKTWEGLLTAMFTTADNYAVNIHYDLPEPLRSLCIAAALTIDTALKQDDK